MGPAQAIRTCFAKSFQFSGRACRSEYWLFLLPGLALPLASFFVLSLSFPTLPVAQNLLLAAPALLPLAAVTSRRLADVGHPTEDMYLPLGALIAFLIGGVAIDGFGAWAGARIDAAGSPGSFFLGLMLAPVFLPLLAAIIAVFLVGLFSGASLFGQMILRAQPGFNTYGPNPLEVSQ